MPLIIKGSSLTPFVPEQYARARRSRLAFLPGTAAHTAVRIIQLAVF